MFGAATGQAEEQLGGQVRAVGTLFGKVAADEQTNSYLDAVEDATTKFRSLQGREAMDAYPALQAQIKDLATQGRNNLTTTEQQLEFDQQTQFLTRRALSEAGSHYDSQFKIWGQAVANGQSDLAVRGIGSAAQAGNDEAIKNYTADLMDGRIKAAQHIYGTNLPPEIYNDVLDKARGEAAAAQVEGALPTDPARAKRYLDENANTLRGPLYDSLNTKLKAHTAAAEGFQALQEARGSAAAGGGTKSGVPAANVLSAQQIAQHARNAGFPEDKIPLITAISLAESGGNPNASNEKGEHSYGLTQINADAHGPEAHEALGNPDKAMQLAFQVSKGGEDFSPWTMYRNGQYKQFLGGESSQPAMAAPPPPDQLQGQPAAPASIRPVTQGDRSTPPPTPPAGMAGIAAMEQEQAANHARTGANLDSMLSGGKITPEAWQHARTIEDAQFKDHQASINASKAALIEQRTAAADAVLQEIRANPTDAAKQAELSNRITNDPMLEGMRFQLGQQQEQILKGTAVGAERDFGPGYFDVVRRMGLPPDDPNRIADFSQLLAMARPDDTGFRWLSDRGMEQAAKDLAGTKKAETAGDLEIKQSQLAMAKHILSFEADYGYYKVPDPAGTAAMARFMPAFQKYWDSPQRLQDQAKGNSATGESPMTQAIVSLAENYKRTNAQFQKDFMAATGENEAQTQIKTPADLAGAVGAGTVTRAQAEKIGIDHGWIVPPAPPAAAAPQAPMAR